MYHLKLFSLKLLNRNSFSVQKYATAIQHTKCFPNFSNHLNFSVEENILTFSFLQTICPSSYNLLIFCLTNYFVNEERLISLKIFFQLFASWEKKSLRLLQIFLFSSLSPINDVELRNWRKFTSIFSIYSKFLRWKTKQKSNA